MPQISECFDDQHTPITCGSDQVDQINEELSRLSGNDNFLKQFLEITQQGQALFACSAPVTDVEIGMPVYFDATSETFKPAFIAFEEQEGELILAPSAQVHGLITSYTTGGATATVLLLGLGAANLESSTGFASPTGVFFLSRDPGILSLEADPAVSLPVLSALGDGRVVFRPQWASPHSLYRIRKFDLDAGPAGSSLTVSGHVQITGDGDITQPGWLASDSAAFTGMNVPEGAAFGYNLAAHLDVQEVWPPVPLSLARVEWQVSGDGRSGAGEVSSDLLQLNEDGLWWMSDCADQVPWSNTGSGSSCGSRVDAALRLYFPASLITETGRVSSLQSLSPGLKFYRTGTTDEATGGDLSAELSVAWSLGSEITNTSALAVKGIDEQGLLSRGPIVGGLKSLSTEIEIAGGSVDANGYQSGQLTITLGGPQRAELLPQRISLDGGATDESFDINLAVGFPPNQSSAIRSQFYIPTLDDSDFYLVQYEFWVQAAESGVLPELSSSARAWTRPVNGAATNSPDTDTALEITVPATTLNPDQYIEVVSGAFAVKAGSTLTIQILRDVSGGDRSSIQARVLKQLLRIIRPAEDDEVIDPDTPTGSGIYGAEYATEYS